MFLIASLVPFVVLANIVVANPTVVRDSSSPITLQVTRKVGTLGATELVKRDQRRARTLMGEGRTFPRGTPGADDSVVNLASNYVAVIGVGDPPNYYELFVDTGSSITWVGANRPYVKTSTSVKTHNSVSVGYIASFWSFTGTVYNDTVTIAPGIVDQHQSIGVKPTPNGNSAGVDGILGLGPTGLTIGALSPDVNNIVPTVTDNLFHNGVIPSNILSVSFEPTDKKIAENGELMFGGVNPNKFTGPLTYVPITGSSSLWSFKQSIRYGDTQILENVSGILDTGTTLIYLPEDAYNRYRDATGAVMDPFTGSLRITPAQFSNLKSLFFEIGGRPFEFTPNAQIWPRALSEGNKGTQDYLSLIINKAWSGKGFVCGFMFYERFYVVHDTTNKRIGFAETPFTKSDIN